MEKQQTKEKTEQVPQQQQTQQIQPPIQMSPFNALAIMTQALVNANNHAMMIQQVTGAKIEPIKDNLMLIANHIDLLRNWMMKELKMIPAQPMNRQQLRRAQKEINKHKSKKS